jgi:hypothetical protein
VERKLFGIVLDACVTFKISKKLVIIIFIFKSKFGGFQSTKVRKKIKCPKDKRMIKDFSKLMFSL